MKSPPSTTVFGIPEILRMICAYLDAGALKQMAIVNRLCYQTVTSIVWQQLIVPKDWYDHDLTSLLVALDRYGSIVRRLSLELSSVARASVSLDSAKIQQQLDQILARTPHVNALDLQLPAIMSSKILASTVAKRLPGLARLETDLLRWNEDDVRLLFEGCKTLTHISVHELTAASMKVIANLTVQDRPQSKSLERFKCIHGSFEPDELVAFVSHFPDLAELSVPVQQYLTSKALIEIASHCTKLETLNFNFCLGLTTTGYQAILGANPRLRVLDLGMTEATDQDVALLATHCPGLESLSLPFCAGVTHESIRQVVRHCDKLEYLDISWCEGVKLSIFENDNEEQEDRERQLGETERKAADETVMHEAGDEQVSQASSTRRRPRPFWACTRLRHLDISGIHATYTEDESTAPGLLPAMYAQLAELRNLELLNMSGHGFSLNLNPLALEAFANDRLRHLETLGLNRMKEKLPWCDLIAIGNLFPRLRQLQFERKDITVIDQVEKEKAGFQKNKATKEVNGLDTCQKNTELSFSKDEGSAVSTVDGEPRVLRATLRSGLEISVKMRSNVSGDEDDSEEEAFEGEPGGMGRSFSLRTFGITGAGGGNDGASEDKGPTWGFPSMPL